MRLFYTGLYYAHTLQEYLMSVINNNLLSIDLEDIHEIEIPNKYYFEFIKSYAINIKETQISTSDGYAMVYYGEKEDKYNRFYCQIENGFIRQILFDSEQISNLFHLIEYESEKDTIVYSRICDGIYNKLNLEKKEDRDLLFAIEINDIETFMKHNDLFNYIQFQRMNVLNDMEINRELNFEIDEELECMEEEIE